MENTIDVVSEQGVVDPATKAVTETGTGEAAGAVQQEQSQPGAVAKPHQDSETNAAFAAMRREKERLEAELSKARTQSDRLVNALRTDGYKGATADDLADELDAQRENISVADLRSRRDADAKRIAELVQKDPAYRKAQEDAQRYRELVHRNVMEKDIAEINAAYPDAGLKDLSELGEQFAKLRANGVDNLIAYNAVKGSKATAQTAVPPTPGEVNASTGNGEKDYYSPEDVDRLKPSDLTADVMSKIRKSMLKWRR